MTDAQQLTVEHLHHLAPDLVRVPLGIELGLDIGPLRPDPKLLLLLDVGVGPLGHQLGLLQPQTARADVPPPEGHDVATEVV